MPEEERLKDWDEFCKRGVDGLNVATVLGEGGMHVCLFEDAQLAALTDADGSPEMSVEGGVPLLADQGTGMEMGLL